MIFIVPLLSLLDTSAAFDIVDYDIFHRTYSKELGFKLF